MGRGVIAVAPSQAGVQPIMLAPLAACWPRIMRMVIAKEARPIKMLRVIACIRLRSFRSGDRNDGNCCADHHGGNEERCNERESNALGGFETDGHGIYSLISGDPDHPAADAKGIAWSVPVP